MARIGQGAQLSHSTDGVTYTPIARLDEIGEFGIGEGDDIDVTTHDSASGIREFTRGLVDPGEITFSGQWEGHASQKLPMTGAGTAIGNGPTSSNDYFKIVLPGSNGTWTGRGYWKSFKINPALDDVIAFTGSIKVSGAPTFVVP